jgi:nicotinamidase-related amidase
METPLGILANVKAGSCFVEKSWGADFVDSMKPLPEDIIVKGKLGLCGFESTNLDFVLRQLKVDTIALGGLLTNCCVESVPI